MDPDLDELVRAACNGDQRARKKLGPWLDGVVQQFFARCHKNTDLCAELCQDTMEDVWTKIPERHPATAHEFVEMVYGMAWTSRLRARLLAAREHQYQAKLHLLSEPPPTRSPTSKLTQQEIMARYLPELTTPQRDVVRWAIEGGTLTQFATERGIPEGTARSRYRSGINQLRQRLADDGLTPGQCGL